VTENSKTVHNSDLKGASDIKNERLHGCIRIGKVDVMRVESGWKVNTCTEFSPGTISRHPEMLFFDMLVSMTRSDNDNEHQLVISRKLRDDLLDSELQHER